MAVFRVEIGVLLEDGTTGWPEELSSYAESDDLDLIISNLLFNARSAEREVTGIRTTRQEKEA